MSRAKDGGEPYPWLSAGIATLLLFVLLTEWIRPLTQLAMVTGIHVIDPFLIAVFGFVALDYLRLNMWVAWPLKLVVCWVLISLFYYDSFLFDRTWWQEYSAVSMRDLEHLLSGQTAAISGENRTLLLLAGFSLMIYSLHTIIVRRQYVGWFVTLTVAYLAVLQLGFGLDTTRGVMVSIVAGLILSAVLTPVRWRSLIAAADARRSGFAGGRRSSRQQGTDQVSGSSSEFAIPRSKQLAAVLCSLMVIGLAVLSGLWMTAEQPRLSQPWRWNVHAFIQEAASFARGSLPLKTTVRSSWLGIGQSGYSPGDYTLGGQVIPADTPVFTARSEAVTYWRGESKAYYDGRGWSNGDANQAVIEVPNPTAEGAGSDRGIDAGRSVFSQDTIITQEIKMDETASWFLENTLFSGGEILSVEVLSIFSSNSSDSVNDSSGIAEAEPGTAAGRNSSPLMLDPASQRYWIEAADSHVRSYRVEVRPILHDSFESARIDRLYREAAADGLQIPLPEEEKRRYLQLPESMSPRVYELASRITAGTDTDLARARALAEYLRSNYAYDLDGHGKPAEGMDFVEYFLFEHPFGYCDHFSTSMVVMLRMNGIPARWVAGFAPGNLTMEDNGEVRSDVRALHAHSWVEAYIPEVGWIAFEPTPGYAGSLGAVSALAVDAAASRDELSTEPAWWQGPASILITQVSKEVEEMEGDWLARVQKWTQEQYNEWLSKLPVDINGVHLAIIAAAGCAMIILGIIARRPLRMMLLHRQIDKRIRGMERRGGTLAVLELLWQDVMRRYGALKPGQTLREYVLALPLRTEEQRQALIELAHLYESVRYDERLPARISRSRMSRLWREALS